MLEDHLSQKKSNGAQYHLIILTPREDGMYLPIYYMEYTQWEIPQYLTFVMVKTEKNDGYEYS